MGGPPWRGSEREGLVPAMALEPGAEHGDGAGFSAVPPCAVPPSEIVSSGLPCRETRSVEVDASP